MHPSPHRPNRQPATAKNSVSKPRPIATRQREMQSTMIAGRDSSVSKKNRSGNLNSNSNLQRGSRYDASSRVRFQASVSESKMASKLASKAGFVNNNSQPINKNENSNGNRPLREHKPSVSPFDIGQENKDVKIQVQVVDPKRQQKHHQQSYLNQIKHINSEYITLLHTIARQNIPPLQPQPPQPSHPTEPAQPQPQPPPFNPNRIPRNQRYQFECLKLLQKTTEMIERIRQIHEVKREWEIVESVGEGIGVGNGVGMSEVVQRIVGKYFGLEKQVQIAKQQYNKLNNPHNPSKSNPNPTDLSPIPILQTTYKKSQKKLSKIMSQQLQYQKKCTYYQQKLQNLHIQVKKAEKDRLSIEMKLIADTSRNQRLVRKKKEGRNRDRERERSVKECKQRQRGKVEGIGPRAKSAIRFFMH